MYFWRKAFMAGLAAISFGAAEAAPILDTGTPTGGALLTLNNLGTLNNPGASFQNLGVTFNVGAASSITSVEGWIGANSLASLGNVLFELHAAATPGGAVLFSSLVAIDGTAEAWRGATGLSWAVAAGDYTLTLTPESGFEGYMRDGAPSPAGTEWFNNFLVGDWTPLSFNLGWRIGADPAGVPEPATLALLGLGLAGLGFMRRKKA